MERRSSKSTVPRYFSCRPTMPVPRKSGSAPTWARLDETQGQVREHINDATTLDADLLVAADGIHSTVRAQLFGQQDPEFSGYLCWRAFIPAERLQRADVPHSCTAWWGPDRTGVVFWVDGGRTMNFIGTVPSAEVRSDSWGTKGKASDLLASYPGACESLTSIVHAVEEPFITGIDTRPVIEWWHTDRIVLVGDACHPIWLFLANGATQAMGDGYVLARCLARAEDNDLVQVLEEFQVRRLPRVPDVARVSQEMALTYHMREPAQVAQCNASVRERSITVPHGEWLRGWLSGYDVVSEADRLLSEIDFLPAPALVAPAPDSN